jgi:hypothetical protein
MVSQIGFLFKNMKALLLLLISISSFGQMINMELAQPTTRQYLGKSFVATIKEANTGLLVVCYPGSGEAFGPADGSRLSAINYGFDESIQWPFTIMKVQTIGSNNFVSWAEIQKYIDDHSTAAVVIGWSQGAREAMDLLLGFQGRKLSSKVKLVVAIDGPASGNPDYTKASVPLVMVSSKIGEYYYPLKTQEKALLTAGKQVDFIEMDNLNHKGLMNFVYSNTDIISKIASFTTQPTERKIVSTVVKDNVVTFIDDQGGKYVLQVNAAE